MTSASAGITSSGLAVHVRDATQREPLHVDDLEAHRLGQRREQRHAAADRDRVDEQVKLVREARADKALRERGTTVRDERTPRLLLELGDVVGERARSDARLA